MASATRYALVTGASSGIGLGIAQELLRQGYVVFVNGRSADRLTAAVATIPEEHRTRLHFAVGDVSDETDIIRVLAEVAAKTDGKLDVLINNAGATEQGVTVGAPTFTSAGLQRTLQSFLIGPTVTLHHAVPLLEKAAKDRGATASVVNISSVAAVRASSFVQAYCVAKAAIDCLTKSTAADLASRGIRVNAVSPGPVRTGVFAAMGLSEEAAEATFASFADKLPLRRAGEPADIANLVGFLADSSKSSWITGAIHTIDGGALATGL